MPASDSKHVAKRPEDRTAKRINRAFHTLSACHHVLVHATAESDLVREICRTIVETGGYELAWVGYAEDGPRRPVRPVAYAGVNAVYIETVHVSWGEDERGRGPAGTAIRTGANVVIRDVDADPSLELWREVVLASGYHSVLAVPLRDEVRVFGAVVVYAATRHAFDEDETRLLSELGADLAFGIATLRQKAEKERAELGRRHLLQLIDAVLQLPVILYRIDGKGVITDSRGRGLERMATADQQAVGLNMMEQLPGLRDRFEAALAGQTVSFEARVEHAAAPGGFREDWCYQNHLVFDAANGAGAIGFALDVTEQRRAEAVIAEREEQLRGIAENLPGAVFRRVLKPDGTIAYPYVSPRLQALYGIDPAWLMRDGRRMSEFLHPEDQQVLRDAHARSAASLSLLQLQLRIAGIDGQPRWISLVSRPRRLETGDIQWDGILLDVTEVKQLEAERDYLTYYDQLTGLPNQSLLIDRMAQALVQAKRTGTGAAAICLKVESLKDIGDSGGLEAVDAVVKQAAERLLAALQPGDTLAHLGGGRFCVLCNGLAGAAQAADCAARLGQGFEAPFLVGATELYAKAHFGISLYPDDADSPTALIQNATAALNRARSASQHRYEFYNAQMTESTTLRMNTEAELRRAIERREIEVFYQPVVRPIGGEITGLEALARWRHPSRGLLLPGSFIQVAEQTGLIVPLGDLMLRQACEQAARWRRDGLCPFPVSVNVSGWQLMREDFAERLMAILGETGLPPAGLQIELTESTILRDIDFVTVMMREVAARGVGFAIDDFGIEHSALSRLPQLPVHTLKVDRSFISQMTHDPGHATLVQAIVAMARAMNKKAVAEGVETHEELIYLRAYQYDAVQGNLFCPAVPAKTCATLLRRGSLRPSEMAAKAPPHQSGD